MMQASPLDEFADCTPQLQGSHYGQIDLSGHANAVLGDVHHHHYHAHTRAPQGAAQGRCNIFRSGQVAAIKLRSLKRPHYGNKLSSVSNNSSARVLTAADGLSNVNWVVRRPLSNVFTGRVDDVSYITESLRAAHSTTFDGQSKCFVVTGMGGQGKSELCLKVAHDLRHE